MRSGRSPIGAVPRLLVATALLATLAGCACPTPVERWDTPLATLELWQAYLCRDEAEDEYGCLSLDFQNAMGAFENYYRGRSQLLHDRPGAAWLFSHADLESHVRSTSIAPDGQHATIVLATGDQSLAVSFEREAWVTITWDDGHVVTARQTEPLPALVVHDKGARQWLALLRPPLEDPTHVSSVQFAARWLISDLGGLASGEPRTGAAP